ncbi:LacI family DNA-binding transcriptional regulator [Vallitalea sp.]|jgi:LacI family transcriptional regulator|uniref:LacI family DNA-binding transcriptional regulator n=1 Tax=Vallitalea sp. TaxID=1882829 RepID=UPI0025E8F2B5|nr:LacI family DNA-binding transcriptional regulator [Vallitalea sp.]MCT4685887.1 LacI family transcriptional regulator [Vallitalea sp.]
MSKSIIDVAKLAGVSKSTVSRVLNSGSVKPETRDKVYEAIKQLNYYPNAMARGLKGKSNHIIGVIIPKITGKTSSVFESKQSLAILNGIEEIIGKKDYSLLLIFELVTDEDKFKDDEHDYQKYFRENKIDGLIILAKRNNDKNLQKAIKKYKPIVYIGERFQDYGGYNIYVHYLKFNKQVYNYLYKKGHTNIVSLTNRGTIWEIGVRKYDAYKDFCMKNSIIYDENNIIDVNKIKKNLYDVIEDKIANGCTALYLEDSYLTIEVMNILYKMGKKIPSDISIISIEHGGNDISSIYPFITTVNIPNYEMGKESSSLLINILENKKVNDKEILLKPHIIERESVKKLT